MWYFKVHLSTIDWLFLERLLFTPQNYFWWLVLTVFNGATKEQSLCKVWENKSVNAWFQSANCWFLFNRPDDFKSSILFDYEASKSKSGLHFVVKPWIYCDIFKIRTASWIQSHLLLHSMFFAPIRGHVRLPFVQLCPDKLHLSGFPECVRGLARWKQ